MQHISRSDYMINGKDIVNEFHTLTNTETNTDSNSNVDNKCKEVEEQLKWENGKEIIQKLDNIELTIFYHSIIDDEPTQSKRLQYNQYDDKQLNNK